MLCFSAKMLYWVGNQFSLPSPAAVRQSVPNSVHTQRLPAPTFSPPGRWGPPGAGFPARGRCPWRLAAQGSVPGRKEPRSPTAHSFPLGLRGSLVSEARRAGSVRLAVTSLLPRSYGCGRFSCLLRSVLAPVIMDWNAAPMFSIPFIIVSLIFSFPSLNH